ncbi:CYFA0S02e06062g1_1 [Cyberlindnera fabianii]|uniref:rRNA methyltransferase 1, mitochondrial n=1 Tax=Cyberlindnera fabianii TaxID=36022 RepID=A0A061ATT9_CYBFA|nr:CYFA0S02e06062g1_1 [Cyberlindnera fabianii]
MLNFKQAFSTSSKLAKAIKPAVRSTRHSKDVESMDKNIPFEKPQKAWERAGESKDDYFRSRFSHVHAKQKQNDPAERRKSYETIRKTRASNYKRERYNDRQQHKQKFARDVYRGLTPNPLSEYVYGSSAVLAALKANKREIFNKLFIHNPKEMNSEIIKLATQLGVETNMVDSRSQLNQLTSNAIHNGYVLETKPLLPTPIFKLGTVSDGSYTIDEDNYGDVLEQTYTTTNKNPLGIYLDGITDPHNIGAIIRSAYFLGADFIVMSEKNCAPLSPAVAKTSVGAMELIPIFTADKPLTFFDKSRANGWTFVSAAVADHHREDKIARSLEQKSVEFEELSQLLESGPCMLVLGSEGDGIRTTLKVRSDFLVEIKPAAGVSSLVDSLNVSVAGALLMQKLLQ